MRVNFNFKFFVYILLLFFSINTIYSINYFPSDGVFNANIIEVYDTGNYNYEVKFNFSNLANQKLEYDVEIIYKLENLFSGSDKFSCRGICKDSLKINKLFFGDYEMIITSKYNGRYYRQNLPFTIQLVQDSYDVIIQDTYYIENGTINLAGLVESDSNTQTKYFFEIYPQSSVDLITIYNQTCYNNCNFNIFISSPVILDTYNVNIYSSSGDMQKSFSAIYKPQLNSTIINSTKFVDFKQKNNTIDYFLYNNDNKSVDADFTIKYKNLDVNLSKIDINTNYDIEFDFKNTSIKKIKVNNVKIDDISIGYEKVPIEKINLLNTVVDAFAINPQIKNPTQTYSLTFVAQGYSLLKCIDYNFTTQTCFGEYKKILDTIPGREYTLNLVALDPQFVQVTDYIISPSAAACQDSGGGYSSANCDDTSYVGYGTCDGSAEYTFCDDGLLESHTMARAASGGVQMYFQDVSRSNCENIEKVEVIYNLWFAGTDTKGVRSLLIDADGNGFTPTTFTIDTTDPGTNRVLDVTTGVLPVGEFWNCSDFFQSGATAGIEALYDGNGASRNGAYTLNVDTLVYRVSYNYSVDPLDMNQPIYIQQDTASILGSTIWNNGSTVYLNITRNDSTTDVLTSQIPDINGSFSTTYSIGDYYAQGQYKLFAIQGNDSTKNDTHYFNVTKRAPLLNKDKTYLSSGQKVQFIGSIWNKSGVVNITRNPIQSSFLINTSDYVNTNSLGSFIYNWTVPNDLFIDNGDYIFNFTEMQDSSYNNFETIKVVFRPNATTGTLANINDSDGLSYNVNTGPQPDFINIDFPQLIPTKYKAASLVVYLEYDTVDTGFLRELRWLNVTSGTYDTICTYPDSPGAQTIYGCNITTYANLQDDFNNLNLQLWENGKNGDDWNVNFIYIERKITIKPIFLKVSKNITRLDNDNFSIYLEVQNLYESKSSDFKDIVIYNFIPIKFNITSNFLYESSLWYLTSYSNETLNDPIYNGTIFKWTLSAITSSNSVFDGYSGIKNNNNSWYVSFNVTGNEIYNYDDLFLVSLDPIQNYNIKSNFFEKFQGDLLCH